MHKLQLLKIIKEFVYLRRVMIEITRRCNFKCKFCYLDGENSSLEISKERLFQIAEELKPLGVGRVLFLGGEPLIRADFSSIYKYFYDLDFLCEIDTNGSLITSQIAKLFKEYPPFSLKISIYAGTKEGYKKITGVEEAYEKVMRGVRFLKEKGVEFSLHFLVTKDIIPEVNQMEKIAKEFASPYLVDTAKIFDCRKKVYPFFSVGSEDLEYISRMAPDFVSQLRKVRERHRKYRFCRGVIYITSDEQVLLCPVKRSPRYDFKNSSLADILASVVMEDIKIECPFGEKEICWKMLR